MLLGSTWLYFRILGIWNNPRIMLELNGFKFEGVAPHGQLSRSWAYSLHMFANVCSQHWIRNLGPLHLYITHVYEILYQFYTKVFFSQQHRNRDITWRKLPYNCHYFVFIIYQCHILNSLILTWHNVRNSCLCLTYLHNLERSKMFIKSSSRSM